MIQNRVIREFNLEMERAKQPGYVSRYDDIDVDDTTIHAHAPHGGAPPAHYRPAASKEPSTSKEATVRLAPRESADSPTNAAAARVQSPEPYPRPPHRLPAAQQPADQTRGGNPPPGAGAQQPGPLAAAPKPSTFGAGLF